MAHVMHCFHLSLWQVFNDWAIEAYLRCVCVCVCVCGRGVEICMGQFFTTTPLVLCILVYRCRGVFAVGKNCHKRFEAVKVCGCRATKYRNTRRKTHIVFCSTEAQIQMATKRSNQIFRTFYRLLKSKRTDHSMFNLSTLTNAKHKPHCPHLYLCTSDVVTSALTVISNTILLSSSMGFAQSVAELVK